MRIPVGGGQHGIVDDRAKEYIDGLLECIDGLRARLKAEQSADLEEAHRRYQYEADRATALQAQVDGLRDELARQKAKKARPRHVDQSRYARAVRAAGARGKEWHLHRDEYATLVGNPCSYCGEPTGSGIGLDRLDNSRGYTLDNVTPCCGPCNLLRGNRLTPEQTRAAAQAIRHMKEPVT